MTQLEHGGKTLKECIGILRDSCRKGEYSLENLAWGVESLRDSPEDMRAYHDALTDIALDEVSKAAAKGINKPSVQKVNAGTPIKEVAKELAYDHLRRLINLYGTEEVHEKWNAALPELKTAGGFVLF